MSNNILHVQSSGIFHIWSAFWKKMVGRGDSRLKGSRLLYYNFSFPCCIKRKATAFSLCLHKETVRTMKSTKTNNGAGSSVNRTPRCSFSESSDGGSSSALRSLNSTNSLSESPINGAIRMFNSPLTNFKNKVTTKAKRIHLPKKGNTRGAQRRSSERELELDNSEYLSGLMSSSAKHLPHDIDKSFASDFDESGRWMSQI